MRAGEIVRFDYDNIGRVAIIEYENDARQEGVQLGDLCRLEGHPCWITVASLEIVTVAELFDAAGHPVPKGAMLYWDPWMAGMWWFWTDRDTGFFDDDCWQLAHEVRFAGHDLSRTPALDMWRCLPEIVKAVVK